MTVDRVSGASNQYAPIGGDTTIPGTNLKWSDAMLIISQTTQNGPGGPVAAGALTIPPPSLDIDALETLFEQAQSELQQYQLAGQKIQIQAHRDENASALQDADKQLQAFLANVKSAQEEQSKQAIGNWFKAIFELIGAVCMGAVLGSLSGGTLAVAVVGLIATAVMALMDLADSSAHAAGATVTYDGKTKAMDISFAGMVEAIVNALPSTKDKTPEEKAKIVNATGEALMIMMTVISVAGGFASTGMVGPVASAVKAVAAGGKTAKEGLEILDEAMADLETSAGKLEAAGKGTAIVADLGEVAAAVANGSSQIVAGRAQMAADNADAARQLAAAMAEYFNNLVQSDGSAMKNTFTAIQDMAGRLSDLIKTYLEGQQTLAANLAAAS